MKPIPFLWHFTLLALLGLWLAVAHTPTITATPTDPPYEWEFTTLDSAGDVGSHLSLAVQPGTNIPHVAYYSVEEGLKLAARTAEGTGNCGSANTWNCTILQPTVEGVSIGRFPALAFRSDGSYGVLYHNSATHTNHYFDSQTTSQTALGTQGYFNQLQYNLNDSPTFLFETNTNVSLSTTVPCPGGGCPMLHGANVSALAIDANLLGTPSAVLIDEYDDLYYASQRPGNIGGNCANGAWQCTHLQDLLNTIGPDGSSYTGIAFYQSKCLLPSNCTLKSTVAWYNYEWGSMNICTIDLTRCTSWQGVGTAPRPINTSPLEWPVGMDLVVYENKLLLFYQDFNDQPFNAVVKMAYEVPAGTGNCGGDNTWQCIVVDDGNRGGGFISVGFGLQAAVVDGRILLAYYDLFNKDLILAETAVPLPPIENNFIYLPLVVK